MQQIIRNFALIQLNTFCKEKGIDYSGTYLIRDNERKFIYSLVKDGTTKRLVSIELFKNKVPTFYSHIIK